MGGPSDDEGDEYEYDAIAVSPEPTAAEATPPRGTGSVFPTKFNPPSPTIKPTQLFRGQPTYARLTRYIHREDPRKCLILTDEACLNNGKADPQRVEYGGRRSCKAGSYEGCS
ncbi:hypothetical protein F5Y17DRAFT_416090 [Xylariaceae sp. FL0594]|nr:hypothetical protein F5Y17DRAFT_416090 [Xylariaceae sp. FL0594]